MSKQIEFTGEDIPAGVGPWPLTLCGVWAPMLDLAKAGRSHPVKLGNIGYLLDRLARPQATASVLSFALASYLSPPMMRQWIALRAGQSALSFRFLPCRGMAGAEHLGEQWLVLQEHVQHFRKLSQLSRAWVISALSQLTLYEDCMRLAQRLSFDLDKTADAALAYEVGRALQRVDVHHALPVQLFRGILSGKADPYLRAACAIQFMVRASRYQPDRRMAMSASLKGEQILQAEGLHPRDRFRYALMCSRFFRSDALVRIVHGGPRSPSETVGLARLWHEEAEQCNGGSTEHVQLLVENKRLVVEASLKLVTNDPTHDGSDLVRELIETDGADPDCLAFVGNYWASRQDWRRASAWHLRAMRRGAVRSVLSAISAGDLLASHGRPDSARRAFERGLVLDGASTAARARLRDLTAECRGMGHGVQA